MFVTGEGVAMALKSPQIIILHNDLIITMDLQEFTKSSLGPICESEISEPSLHPPLPMTNIGSRHLEDVD